MPLRQYAYFALISKHTSAAEMTAFLGIEPDEVLVRGSRMTEPAVIPTAHKWKIVCREPGLRVDEQIARVVDRLAPHTQRVAELSARLAAEGEPMHSGAVLEVVRYFNDDAPTAGPQQAQPTEASNLFGWHIDRSVMDFLAATGAVLDVDEYDMSPEPSDEEPEQAVGP
ncbi:DUF4279 domain-containing protein [Yinghuangia seranimata]|uniref:DUF4279 domain-containing protein n=1 Tax=Yinghuangia seranimata TaxID=408067 RepID=UPI00248D0FFE|nr:DUF4279 domain-containing protein [Yinghuangia seranimata]MDI2131583.1 DUF4279 domain-containing protein [Yinghuangia seranimata]